MPKKPAAFGASALSSFTHLVESPAEAGQWVWLDNWLRDELVKKEPAWNEAVWAQFQKDADSRFPVELKGIAKKAKRVVENQPKVAQDMLKADIVLGSCASVYLARKVGALDLTAPLLAWAAIPVSKIERNLGDLALLRYLASAGANPNLTWQHDLTALHIVALREFKPAGHPRAIRLLLNAGANPDLQNDKGETALHRLCNFERIDGSVAEGIRALRAAGASINIQRQEGETALQLLELGCMDGEPEGEESEKNRREILGEFQRDDFDNLLPMGAPSVRPDIDGARR